jgi:hypothetical protein
MLALNLEGDALGLNWPAIDARIDGLTRAFAEIEAIGKRRADFQEVSAQAIHNEG